VAEELLSCCFKVRGRDFENAGEASTEIKSLLKELEIDPHVIRRAVVVAFEAEMNVVMYADEANVTFVLTDEDICIETDDRGPGIPDIDLALQEGWSTATDEMREMGFGFGMGLPNIKKNADHLEIRSVVGDGTTITALIKLGVDGSDHG
jgi:anti-sigma regulatory factor (Ser/Thr protein kinase)